MFRRLSVVASDVTRIDLRVYPHRKSRKRSLLVAAAGLAATALLAGCGGGGGGGGGGTTTAAEAQRVVGDGFSVGVPKGWTVERGARTVTLRRGSGPALASVTVLTLRKRYEPALFTRVSHELDRVSDALAEKLGGKVVARRTIVVAGLRSRQYDLAYERAGAALIDRITYVLRGLSEYELLCRWQADEGESGVCGLLATSFRLR
jgi:hypothetical protein